MCREVSNREGEVYETFLGGSYPRCGAEGSRFGRRGTELWRRSEGFKSNRFEMRLGRI